MSKTIHHSIPSQLSSTINESYPLFVEFLKGYYEWIETKESPYHSIRNHLSYLDFKDSVESYTSMMKREYLEGIPEGVLADKELLIKYSKHFFGSVGTEKSFEFLFKVLYGEDAQIYYPRDDILRVSDGKWVTDEYVMYVSDSGNVDDFLYKRLTQTKELIPGYFVESYVTVNRVVKRYANGFTFAELYVTDIEGSLDINFPIGIDSDHVEWIFPVCDGVEIIDGGMNYVQDNILEYAGDLDFSVNIQAIDDGVVDTRYTTNFSGTKLNAMIDGDTLTDYDYDGKFLSHQRIVTGSVITLTYPVYSGFVVINDIDNMGSITGVSIIDMPFGIVSNQLMVGLMGGSGGSVNLKPSTIRKLPGYFSNTDGFLSDDKNLQDSNYYQDFSYVIKSGVSIEHYKDGVLKMLHPAGMKMFGEMNILELIKLMIRDVAFSIERKPLDVFLVESYAGLYNRYSFIEDWKYNFGKHTYQTNAFKDIVVSDVCYQVDRQVRIKNIGSIVYDENHNYQHYIYNQRKYEFNLTINKQLNIHDSTITINQGDYVEPGYIVDQMFYITPYMFEYQLEYDLNVI